MSELTANARMFVFDNSRASINGDFGPNRLQSQKLTVTRLIQYYSKQEMPSVFGISVISGPNHGVVTSLTSDPNLLDDSIDAIKTGNDSFFVKSILSSLFAFSNTEYRFERRDIIIFVCSENDISESAAAQIVRAARRGGVDISIVSMGDDVKNDGILESITIQLDGNSNFLKVLPSDNTILSDHVLASKIGPGDGTVNIDNDEDLKLTIEMSLAEQYDYDISDDELKQTIEMSRAEQYEYDISDNELKQIIKASMYPSKDSTDPKDDNQKDSAESEQKKIK